MNPLKFFSCSCLLLLFIACGGSNDPSKLFKIHLEGKGSEYQVHQKVKVTLENRKEKTIGEVSYYIDGEALPFSDNTLTLDVAKLGDKKLVAKVAVEGNSVEIEKNIRILAEEPPTVYTYEIINEFPHDKGAFTQGLEFHEDTLYESTGKRGASSVRKVEFTTGKILQQIDLESKYFGEGITLLNNKLYQLTWQGGTGFVYDVPDLKRNGSFKYGQSKEGWGLCNNGKHIYKSDGTEKIWLLNPETLIEEGFIQTVTNTSIFNKANELEFVDDKIYANVWLKESMMIINSRSGAIEGVVNFGGLKDHVTKHPELDVLNGVAYHPGRKTFFVTGKYWDKLFEVRIKPKE
jgi:glutamine cyclotransferase